MAKTRIDKLLVEKGLAESRERAQAIILTGDVLVDDVPVTKPGKEVERGASVRIRGNGLKYASRGGIKLEHALKEFKIDVRDKICLDIGASTGGFTDCLLQNGASKVYAVDVGYGQLAWELQNNPRVVSIERTNIRYLDKSKLKDDIDIVTVDVSFISLKKVFPVVDEVVLKGGIIIALIKPQFEVGRARVGKGGIVRDEVYREEAVSDICKFARGLGWVCRGVSPSPIEGTKGNKEFLACFTKW